MEIDLERFQKVWAKIISYFEKIFSIIFGSIGGNDDEEETTAAE